MLTIKQLRKMSLVTVLAFAFSMFAGYATPVSAAMLSFGAAAQTTPTSGTAVDVTVDISNLSAVLPQLTALQSTLKSAQTTAQTLETVATPIYNQVVPTNMETMSIVERCKAIINNAKDVLSETLKSSTESANLKRAQGASVIGLEHDEQIALGIQELGKQANKLEVASNNNATIAKIKEVLANVKTTLGKVVTNVRAKIFKVGQKVGLIDENKVFEDGKVIDKSDSSSGSKDAIAAGYAQSSGTKVSFADKLSTGVQEGVANAKASLKNSFSVENLAITTAVSVGTSLAVDVINGETPSLKKAVKQVASLEFAGNVVGSALGAAGGQFAGTLVKTFCPGIVGNLVGSVLPVMFASASGQLSTNIISGIRNGEFSISKAFAQIDKVDLVGSSIGSTIGMTLGSLIPIPVVGSVVGGIVGGVVGSKVAKWVSGLFGGKKSATVATSDVTVNYKEGVTVGTISNKNNEIPVAAAPQISASVETKSKVSSTDEKTLKLIEEAQNNYYEAYLEYNRLIEANDIESAKQVFQKLKKYSDEYSILKKTLK